MCRPGRVKPSGDWLRREDKRFVTPPADNLQLSELSQAVLNPRPTASRLRRTGGCIPLLPPFRRGAPDRPPVDVIGTCGRDVNTIITRLGTRMYTQPAATCRDSRPEMSSTVGYHVTREPPEQPQKNSSITGYFKKLYIWLKNEVHLLQDSHN